VLCLTLVAVTGCDLAKTPGEPTPVEPNVVVYDALGASDTIGIGSSAPCFPLDNCTTGPGYVQRVSRRLQSAGKEVSLQNLGVPGAVLSPGVQAAGNALGLGILRNVLLDEAPYVRRTSTLATVFVGANDANTVARTVREGAGGSNRNAYIQEQIQDFARDMRSFVTTVRGKSPTTKIVALNLPNMAHTPYAAGRSLEEKQVLQQISVGFSAGINALAAQGVTVIDLMCDANFYSPSTFSSDGFHPNDNGYAYMAELVYTAATASVPAPRSSCSFMVVY
jgi:lysophospholipase L1-like esterase